MSKNRSHDYTQRGWPVLSRPVTYSFWFSPVGWANHTLNDITGEYNLESDWGNYQHRWHTGSLGNRPDGKPYTLTEFIAKAGVHYIADKFSYGRQPDLQDVISVEATVRSIRKALQEEGYRDAALKLRVEQAQRWARNHDCNMHVLDLDDEFEELRDALGNYSLGDHIEREKSPRYNLLVEFLLPHFQTYLKPIVEAGEVPTCFVEE